jgi:hypothetical protein
MAGPIENRGESGALNRPDRIPVPNSAAFLRVVGFQEAIDVQDT